MKPGVALEGLCCWEAVAVVSRAPDDAVDAERYSSEPLAERPAVWPQVGIAMGEWRLKVNPGRLFCHGCLSGKRW
jgi:hypothetical protein